MLPNRVKVVVGGMTEEESTSSAAGGSIIMGEASLVIVEAMAVTMWEVPEDTGEGSAGGRHDATVAGVDGVTTSSNRAGEGGEESVKLVSGATPDMGP